MLTEIKCDQFKKKKVSINIPYIPAPDDTGLFKLNDKNIIVVPVASCEELDRADIKCVGEQLYDFIEPRLGTIPQNTSINNELLKSLLPIDKWVYEFLEQANRPWDPFSLISKRFPEKSLTNSRSLPSLLIVTGSIPYSAQRARNPFLSSASMQTWSNPASFKEPSIKTSNLVMLFS